MIETETERANESSNEAIILKKRNLTSEMNTPGETSSSTESVAEIKTYKTRWFILLVICLTNISHSINGFCYTSIADFTGLFYAVDYAHVNLLSTISMIVVVPAGCIALIVIDNFGIRLSLILAGFLNLIGAFIGFLSSAELSNGAPLILIDSKYSVLMLGRVICSIGGPFAFLVTTKFANSWFTQDQRALANTVALISGTLGFLIGAFSSPFIVYSEINYIHQMPTLNSINFGLSAIPAVLVLFITKSMPPTPPHHFSNQEIVESNIKQTLNLKEKVRAYFHQVNQLLRSLPFLLLMISFSIGFGLFNTVSILLQQILCVRGYTNNDVGIFGAILIGSGIIGALIAGFIVDKTKRLEEVAKVCFCVSSIMNLFFTIFQTYNNDDGLIKVLLIIAFCFIGAFGFPLIPVSFLFIVNF